LLPARHWPVPEQSPGKRADARAILIGENEVPFASVNGQQLYFEDTAGNGPVVVFSHGNLMNRDMWVAQVEALHGEFRCVVWDERLHGRTKDDGGLYTYWDAADDLLGLLDHLGVERATLAGHSQGGFLSLHAALCAPERVKALVLTDTAAVAWPPETLAQMSGIRDRFRDGGLDAVAPGPTRQARDLPGLAASLA
ncbi:MAG TPA: alpha/beta hydrolase, partial [Streptosporangiaceae bacterium]|nr:alpha/beta hydrolase [Streptosporangiaceae bacterium]